uniref:Uncharacterized protein n=1 Tax=Rhizophora mucronata TaxID=61149 RepID=A0A2P2R5F3_RHIMU
MVVLLISALCHQDGHLSWCSWFLVCFMKENKLSTLICMLFV